MKIKIGTRSSKLALWQANWVKTQLEQKNDNLLCDIIPIKTSGDKFLNDENLVTDKGMFTKEIEEALLHSKIDIAVHSAKDLPTTIPKNLEISAFTQRELPNDVLISKNNLPITKLPDNAVIGTCSLRRKTQLLQINDTFQFANIRGNIDTRVEKLQSSTSKFNAIILAYSGLKRLSLENHISEILPIEIMLPAAGQGSLAIEANSSNHDVITITKSINHHDTENTVLAERAFLHKLNAGCKMPVGVYGIINQGDLILKGFVADTDGRKILRNKITGKADQWQELGVHLADNILNSGGSEILRGLI